MVVAPHRRAGFVGDEPKRPGGREVGSRSRFGVGDQWLYPDWPLGRLTPAALCSYRWLRPASTAETNGAREAPVQAARIVATAAAPAAAARWARAGESMPPTATRMAEPWGAASAASSRA